MYNRDKLTKKEWLVKAKEYDASAKQREEDAEESFRRCDTDGFLSQMVSGHTSSLHKALAGICRNFGKDTFDGLYKDGVRVKAKLISFRCQYSFSMKSVWLLHEDERSKYGDRKYLPYNHGNGRSRILKQFGLEELTEIDDAWAKYSNNMTCSFPTYFRVGEEWGGSAKLMKEDQ